MDTIVLIILVSACNMAFLLVGAKIMQASKKDESIKLPEIKGPVALYREFRAEKEAEREKDKLDKILGNIDRYDGTGSGQQDV